MEFEKFELPQLGLIECNTYGMSRGWMRYSMQRSGGSMVVKVWPQPFCIEKTPEAQVHIATFPFDEKGREQAAEWISQEYTLFPDDPHTSPISKPPANWKFPKQEELDGGNE
jgi:hypothetical protein